MKWIVGVNLRPSCEGALAWLSWCLERDGDGAEAAAVHVVEWPAASAYPPPDPELVRAEVRTFLSDRGYHLDARVFEGRIPADALAHAMSVHASDILVLGREATREGDELVRLGRVTRRLVRQLPGPVAVCPSDLRHTHIPEGPVMVAVQPGPGCEHAVRFGQRLAARFDRPLTVATAIAPAFPSGITYQPAPRYDGERRQRVADEVSRWLSAQGIAGVEPQLGEGPTVPVLLGMAEELSACMVVTGSRLLTATERLTRSSVGTALASTARVPVVIVPPWP